MAGKRTIVEILLQAKDATARAFGAVGGRLRSLKDSIFSLRTAIAGWVAFVSTRVVGQIVAAFAEQEKAVIRLNTALRVTGRYTEEGTEKIQAMAAEMQNLTTVTDEAALGISATLAQLATGLTTDQLAEAQKAVIGLSEAFGIDLQSAATLVGKTLSGEMNALGRYGIQIDEAGSQQQKFNQIVAQTAGFFDVAVGSAQSLSGQYAQAKNAIGELLETFGQIIAETFRLNEEQGNLRDRINAVNARIRENLPMWVKWGQVGVSVVKAVIVSFANLIRFLYNTGQVIGDVFVILYQSARLNFQRLGNDVIKFVNGAITALNFLKGTAIPLLEPITETAATALDEAKDRLYQDADDIRSVMGGIADAWLDVVDVVKSNPLPVADVATAGGGKNKPLSPAQVAEEQARTTLGQATKALTGFEAGTISTGDFEESMSRIVPELQRLRDSGLLSQDQWTQVTAAIDKFYESAKKAGLLVVSLDETAANTFGQALAQSLREAQEELGNFNDQLATTTVDSMYAFMGASIEAFGAFAEGSNQAGRAFESAMLGALASVASMFAQMFAARATAALAEAVLPSSVLSGTSAGGIAAAGYFTAAALAMSTLAGALRGAARRTAGGAGGGGGARGAEARTNENAREREAATLVIQGGILDMSQPEQADALAAALETLSGRRVIIQRG